MKALTEHREWLAQERAAVGMGWKEQRLVFTSRIGTPLEPDNLRWSWDPLRKRRGLENRNHDLRHSAVSLLPTSECRPTSSGRSSDTPTSGRP
ncbi:hypothetical protein BEK98_37415 [Streptomyces diastatochromogenes]|uniref:Tyr recombinase domain-containing protein n=1 Tax=Streptomyces diastatochromogenes TaxID=42236 RepID=A0A233S225_STRDA|nr:hypothetical protein BEK98_37415 [Streptomyces diastatochromogenes]